MTSAVLLGGCVAADPQSGLTLLTCDDAAQHVADCTGEYLSPPYCEGRALDQAKNLLGQTCEEIRSGTAKSDSAWSTWFDQGEPFEPFFDGPSCVSSSDCSVGSACLERHCFAGLGTAESERLFDQVTHTRAVSTGNAVELLVDNDVTRRWRLQLIDNADRYIYLQALLFEDNAMGWAEARALAAAAQRGVDVRVIVDWASETSGFGTTKILELMIQGGVKVLSFNPAFSWFTTRVSSSLSYNDRIHEKILIADGEEAIMGGRNPGDHYLASGHWRDTDVYLAGPVVRQGEVAFADTWDESARLERVGGCTTKPAGTYCVPNGAETLLDHVLSLAVASDQGPSSGRIVHSNPRRTNPSTGWALYLDLVRAARQSIRIENAYFIPPRKLRAALKDAVRRGVRVEVITNSKESDDLPSTWWPGANYYKELIDAGVDVREWQGNQTIHAKTALFDHAYAVVGSFNLEPRSVWFNGELVFMTTDPTLIERMDESFDDDRVNTEPAPTRFSLFDRTMMAVHRIAEPIL